MSWPEEGEIGMALKPWVLPFLLALGGVLSDYVTTTIGLGMGFYETNPEYHPVNALMIFWGAIALLSLTFPRKHWTLGANGLALTSYLGAINNTLVILGLFSGLHI